MNSDQLKGRNLQGLLRSFNCCLPHTQLEWSFSTTITKRDYTPCIPHLSCHTSRISCLRTWDVHITHLAGNAIIIFLLHGTEVSATDRGAMGKKVDKEEACRNIFYLWVEIKCSFWHSCQNLLIQIVTFCPFCSVQIIFQSLKVMVTYLG